MNISPLRYNRFYLLWLCLLVIPQASVVSAKDTVPSTPVEHVLVFTTIKEGDTFTTGQTIKVGVVTIDNRYADSIAFRIGDYDVVYFAPGALTADVELPKGMDLGPLKVTAIASNKNKDIIYVSEEITIQIVTNESLEDVKIKPSEIFITGNYQEQITVIGKFSDGYYRDISHTSLGTTYEPDDKRMLKVDETGKIIPNLDGITTINVKHGKYSKTIKVYVDGVYSAPEFGFESTKVAYVGEELTFTITATNSQKTIPQLSTETTIKPVNSSFVDYGNGSGRFSWTPNLNDIGVAHVLFIARNPEDPEIFNTLPIEIIVKAIRDAR